MHIYYTTIVICVICNYYCVSCQPRPMSYHISERYKPEVKKFLYDHHFNLSYHGEYQDKTYEPSCLYPLETNRFAPADCVLSPRCGNPVWENLETKWYGQEWGICYGSSLQSKLFSKSFKVYAFNFIHVTTMIDSFVYSLRDDTLNYLRNTFIGIRKNKYYLLPARCLEYMPSSKQVLPSAIRFYVRSEELVYDVISAAQYEQFCHQSPFDTLLELVHSLPIYVNECYKQLCIPRTIKWVEDSCLRPIGHYQNERCYCVDEHNPNYWIDRGCPKKQWDTVRIHFNVHYSNPIVVAFRSVFHFLWHELSFIIEFIFTTLFEVVWGILLVLISALIELCDELNIKVFESVFVGFVTFFACGKVVLSSAIALLIILLGFLI